MAAVLACGLGTTYVSHESAAWIWGLTPLPSPSARVAVTTVGSAPRHRGIRVHRIASIDPPDRLIKKRIPLTSPARTILDLAARSHPLALEQLVAAAKRRHLVSEAKLRDVLERNPRRKGAGPLRTLLRGPEPAFTRSPDERRMLALIRAHNLPEPLTNARLGSYEPDFYWPDQRLIVELDSYGFHSSRASFEADRRRDAENLARGIRTARVTRDQLLYEPGGVAARLARALG